MQQEDTRLQQVMQKLGDTLAEATGGEVMPAARPTVPLNGNGPTENMRKMNERQAAADRDRAVAEADQHELEVAACVTQAWVRELIRKERQLRITPEDIKCLWHALKAIGLVAGA